MSCVVPGRRPTDEECVFTGRFAPADESADYVGFLTRYDVRLAEDRLWVSEELCIPLSAVEDRRIIKDGWLPPRYALRVEFRNPISGVRDVFHLCDVVFLLGFYRLSSLKNLNAALKTALETAAQEEVDERTLPRKQASTQPIEQSGLFRALFHCVKTLCVSRERLEEQVCRQIISAAPEESLPDDEEDMTIREKAQWAYRSSLGGCSSKHNLKAFVDRLVVMHRLLALWTLWWQLALPAILVYCYLRSRPGSQWFLDLDSVVILAVIAIVCFLICLVGSTLVSAVLYRHFIHLLSNHLDIPITILQKRSY